jgi:hypothetical protein
MRVQEILLPLAPSIIRSSSAHRKPRLADALIRTYPLAPNLQAGSGLTAVGTVRSAVLSVPQEQHSRARHDHQSDDGDHHTDHGRALREHQTGQQHDQTHAHHRAGCHPSALPSIIELAGSGEQDQHTSAETGPEPVALRPQRPLDLIEPAAILVR